MLVKIFRLLISPSLRDHYILLIGLTEFIWACNLKYEFLFIEDNFYGIIKTEGYKLDIGFIVHVAWAVLFGAGSELDVMVKFILRIVFCPTEK